MSMSQETFLTILSKCGQQQRVDDMLDSLEEGPLWGLPSLVASVAYEAFHCWSRHLCAVNYPFLDLQMSIG